MRILLISTMRNEGPFLLDWLAHHLSLGVTDVLIYSNDCEDGTETLLDVLHAAGVLTHVRQAPVSKGKTVQWQALKDGWAHPLRKACDWALCIDCDEWINLRAPLTDLPGLIAACGNAEAITLPWRLFGHAGQINAPGGMPPDHFDRAAPADMRYPALAAFFKTLFRLSGPFNGFGVHRPKQRKTSTPHWVDGSGHALPEGFANRPSRINLWGMGTTNDLVQLNHYSVRSAESFMVKRARGLPNHTDKDIGLTYWVERNFNTVEDRSIAHLLPATREKAAQMRRIDGVAAAESQARVWAATKFANLMDDPAEVQLFGRLILAAGSVPPADAVGVGLVRQYQAAQIAQKRQKGSPHD